MSLRTTFQSELTRSVDPLFMARKFFPYCLQQRADGKYILLNRDYKPVGYLADGTAWADYDTWPEAFDLKVTPEQAAAISHKGDPDTQRIYFYDDGCKPWESREHDEAYRRRLAMFLMLEGAPRCESAGKTNGLLVDYFRHGGAQLQSLGRRPSLN